ncbi:leucine-rich repeat protein, partial [Falsiporphyromonas endometrii]
DVVISATDIPSNLKKAVGIKLVGEWGSEEFAELPLALGTSGFLSSNITLERIDMSEARIKEGTSLSKDGLSGKVGIFLNCKKLSTVIMPDAENASKFTDMTGAFQNCIELVKIDLSNCVGVKMLKCSFYGCTKLKDIDLSRMKLLSSKSALAESFSNCESLASVKLPPECQLSNGTFKNCVKLSMIDWRAYSGASIPSYFAGAFEGLSDLSKIQLWVPDSKVSEFREDKNWSKFTIM